MMGCYTEFHAKMILRKDTPDDVVLILMHSIYDPNFYAAWIDHRNNIYGPHPVILPDHKFFTLERWENIFMHSAFLYDAPKCIRTKSGYYELEVHCDINYGHEEVQEFIDWIKPWVAGRKKTQYLGWWTNENIRYRINEYIER
jgi:hypothetical protein